MQQQQPLDKVQRAQYEQIILTVTPTSQQAIQRTDQSRRDVPFETLLQLEELAKSRVSSELRQILARSLVFLVAFLIVAVVVVVALILLRRAAVLGG
jgi:hypothetical protein